MARVIPQKVSEAHGAVSYGVILFSIERQLLRKAFIPLCLIEVKKKSARERPMKREKVAEVLLDLMEF